MTMRAVAALIAALVRRPAANLSFDFGQANAIAIYREAVTNQFEVSNR